MYERHAWQDETDRRGYQRNGQPPSSCPATRDPQVQVHLYEPAIMSITHTISTIEKIVMMSIMGTICITLSAWVYALNFESHIPGNVVDQMNEIPVQHEHLLRKKVLWENI